LPSPRKNGGAAASFPDQMKVVGKLYRLVRLCR
jgi:hypothetical protein